MGIFDSIKKSIQEASEDAISERLNQDLPLTLRMIDELSPHLKEYTIHKFLENRERILKEIENWSPDGIISLSKEFFKSARNHKDFNRKESLACALTGIWLESGARQHDKSRNVFYTIEKIVSDILTVTNKENEHPKIDNNKKIEMLAKAEDCYHTEQNNPKIHENDYPSSKAGLNDIWCPKCRKTYIANIHIDGYRCPKCSELIKSNSYYIDQWDDDHSHTCHMCETKFTPSTSDNKCPVCWTPIK